MGKLKIDDLEQYQIEDIDSKKVQGGFTYVFDYSYFTFTTAYPVPPTFGLEGLSYLEEINYSESIPNEYQVAISSPEGNSLASLAISKTGNSHYIASVSMSSVS